MPQAAIHPLSLDNWATSEQRVGDSGDTDDAGHCPTPLKDSVVLLSAIFDKSALLESSLRLSLEHSNAAIVPQRQTQA
jgi:hypothetical protein